MILASIYIGPSVELPPMVEQNIASLKEHHPDLPHRLFGGEDIEAFLEKHFSREVNDAYRTLLPLAYKADLARYCIIYELGGIYADISHFCTRGLAFDGKRPVVFRDLFLSAPWDTNNALFAAPPRHKALELAIKMVCANVQRRLYGKTYLCPTGPAVFGKALATVCQPGHLVSGISSTMGRELVQREAPGVLLPEVNGFHVLIVRNQVVAFKRKPMEPGLESLGISGSDDYIARWKAREVYG